MRLNIIYISIFNCILRTLVLSYFTLSYVILSHLSLYYRRFFQLIPSYLISSYLMFSSLFLSYLFYLILSYSKCFSYNHQKTTISASRDHFTPSLLYIMSYLSKFVILNNLLLIIQPGTYTVMSTF